jgi:hypothetical protein
MTTKFFEAVGVEKPVLCVPNDEGCLAQVIEEVNAGLAANTALEVQDFIKEKYNEKDSYKFNILGLIGILINYKVKRENYFYCAEFVKYVLEQSSIIELPDLVKPEDFEKIYGLDEIYRGLLREYNTRT